MPISDNKTIIRLDSQFFPDAQFRKAVCKQCKLKEGDVLSLDILSRIENLDLSSLFIDSLEGIEHFRYLKRLDVSLNFLKALDISSLVYLENLNCDGNYLTELTLGSHEHLRKLSCRENRLTSLNLSEVPALTSLSCQENRLR